MSTDRIGPASGGAPNPVGIGGSNMFQTPVGLGPVTDSQKKSWFEALASAWGQCLDAQASKITSLSNQVGNPGANGQDGTDNPSTLVMLTAESQKMAFMSNSAATSNNSVAEASQALARKS